MPPAENNIAVDVRQVSKDYGNVNALKEISLSVADKEFFTLLGPSGCGKTTLLRIVAGFESVSAGTIHLYGEEIADLPANKRPVNTVFQQYSLFPHMTVAENVKFGLQMKGASTSHIEQRTREMLELVQLSEYADRKSTQLSGGQQQRVALARALAPQPQVLLLDEPLSALDLKLRQAMRVELKQIQQETGITFIFVTHDQEEALTMSDRIAIMSDGEVQQVGTAEEIYREPLNRFVADFIGESNLLAASVIDSSGGMLVCELPDGNRISCQSSENTTVGTHGMLCIRPERLVISATADTPGLIHGMVERMVFLGTDTQIGLRLKTGEELLVRVQNSGEQSLNLQTGQAVSVAVDRDSARFLAN